MMPPPSLLPFPGDDTARRRQGGEGKRGAHIVIYHREKLPLQMRGRQTDGRLDGSTQHYSTPLTVLSMLRLNLLSSM